MTHSRFLQRLQNRRGFTITELMIAVTLVTMTMGAFYGAFFTMRNQMAQQSTYMDTNMSAKSAMERISKDAKEAIQIESSYSGNTTGTSVLVLKLPSIDGGGTPTNISSQFDYVVYKLDTNNPTRLTRTLDILNGASQREGGVDVNSRVVAERVSTLTFSSPLPALFGTLTATQINALKRFRVDIFTQDTTLNTDQSTRLQSEIMLRNKLS